MALGIFSTDAFAAGAVPEPIEEAEYPWLYHKVHQVVFFSNSSTTAPGGSWLRQSFDVRSMRKVGPRETLAWVVQYIDVVGAPPVTAISSLVRVLLALP